MIAVERESGVPFVTLAGEFDLANVDAFERAIAAHPHDVPLVIDLSAVSFVDSSILNALVRRYKSADARLVLVLPDSSPIRRVFEVTSLTEILHVVRRRQDAVTAATFNSA